MDVPVAEVPDRLDTLLAELARGAEITLTREGVPVARLVPAPQPAAPPFDREKARAAADGIRALGARLTLGGIPIRELIDEGRR